MVTQLLSHNCSECGHEVGYMAEAYLCPRTRRLAKPHEPVRRDTPRRPNPQPHNGPTLKELLRENTPKRAPAGAWLASFPADAHRAGEADSFPTSPARSTNSQQGLHP